MSVALYLGRHAESGGGIAVYARGLLDANIQALLKRKLPSNILIVFADRCILAADGVEGFCQKYGFEVLETHRSAFSKQYLLCKGEYQLELHLFEFPGGHKLGMLLDQVFIPTVLRKKKAQAQPEVLHCAANLGILRAPCMQLVTVHDLFQAYPPRSLGAEQRQDCSISCFGTLLSQAKSACTRGYYRFFYRLQFLRKDIFICDLGSTAKEILRRYRVDECRLRVQSLGVESEVRKGIALSTDAARALLPFSLPEVFVVLLASSDPRKNTIGQLDALNAYLAREDAEELTVVVVCQDSAIEQHLRETLDATFFIVLPRLARTQFVALLRLAKALLFVSIAEGYGFPILEALCCRTPVLAASVEVLESTSWLKRFVLICDPQSIQSITEGLDRLLRDLTLQAELEALPTEQLEQAIPNMESAMQSTIELYQGEQREQERSI